MILLWRSIEQGLHVFVYWQTYVVAICMTLLIAVPKLFLALLLDRHMYGETPLTKQIVWSLIRYHALSDFEELKDRAIKSKFVGGFRGLVVVMFCELFGTYFGLLTLLPLMTSATDHAAWLLPWVFPFSKPIIFLKLIGLLAITVIVFAKIPILGEMMIYPVSVALLLSIHGAAQELIIPGFWMSCGILAASLVIKWLLLLILSCSTALLLTGLKFSSHPEG